MHRETLGIYEADTSLNRLQRTSAILHPAAIRVGTRRLQQGWVMSAFAAPHVCALYRLPAGLTPKYWNTSAKLLFWVRFAGEKKAGSVAHERASSTIPKEEEEEEEERLYLHLETRERVQTNEAKSKRRRASPTQTTSQRDNTRRRRSSLIITRTT